MHWSDSDDCRYSVGPYGFVGEVVMWWAVAILALIFAYKVRRSRLDEIYQEDQDRWDI